MAWCRINFPDASPSVPEAARTILIMHLKKEKLLTEAGKRAAPIPRPAPNAVSGDALRTARTTRELTQQQLADLFQVPRSTLALWESGQKRVPRRLLPLVRQWVDDGTTPDATDLERREPRTVWEHLLADDILADDDK